VAAACDQQPAILGGEHGSPEIDAGNRPARSFAGSVFPDRDHDCGLAKLLLEAAGDDPDHARMPALPCHKHHGAVALCPGERFGCLADLHLDRTALLIVALQFGGDRLRLGRIFGGEQAHAKVRTADPAAGIDAGPERKSRDRRRSVRA
jgi:hypothetical protein